MKQGAWSKEQGVSVPAGAMHVPCLPAPCSVLPAPYFLL